MSETTKTTETTEAAIAPTAEVASETPKPAPRKRRTRAAAPSAETPQPESVKARKPAASAKPAQTDEAPAKDDAAPAPAPRKRGRKPAAAKVAQEQPAASQAESEDASPAPAEVSRPAKAPSDEPLKQQASSEDPRPRRRPRQSLPETGAKSEPAQEAPEGGAGHAQGGAPHEGKAPQSAPRNNNQNNQNRQRGGSSNNGQGSQRNKRNNNQGNNNQAGQYNAHGRRQKRRGGVNEPVVPQVNKDELAALKVAELRAKAAELGLDTKAFPKKAELVDAVFEAALKAEGFITVSGLLDLLPEGYGFLRSSGYLPGEHDTYVGANTVRRNGLRRGDFIVGQLRPARDNEKYAALHRIDTINGKPFAEMRNRVKFSDLTPVYPDERLTMEHGKNTITARTIDLVAPIGKGQRGLIVSPPKAGKTTILKDIAASITANNPNVHLMCLLVDERPEEVTDMERSIHGEVISSTFDMPCENHIAVSELVIERAKRLVEMGEDVVILLDSITRLARAYNLAQPASGRILSGGVDSTALYPPKRFLGAARNIENGGSLTILASALIDTGSKMDEVIFEEFKGTGNMELKLDRTLADRRVFPAIDPVTSGTRKEELLLDPQEAPFIWGVRRILANMNNTERAMEMLIKGLRQTDSNQEFLVRTAKKAQDRNNSLEL